MNEIKNIRKVPIHDGRTGRPKEVEVHGSTKLGEVQEPEIIGGSGASRYGPTEILDDEMVNTEHQEVEFRVHPQPETFDLVKQDKDQ